jgi:hypothetical protein
MFVSGRYVCNPGCNPGTKNKRPSRSSAARAKRLCYKIPKGDILQKTPTDRCVIIGPSGRYVCNPGCNPGKKNKRPSRSSAARAKRLCYKIPKGDILQKTPTDRCVIIGPSGRYVCNPGCNPGTKNKRPSRSSAARAKMRMLKDFLPSRHIQSYTKLD